MSSTIFKVVSGCKSNVGGRVFTSSSRVVEVSMDCSRIEATILKYSFRILAFKISSVGPLMS